MQILDTIDNRFKIDVTPSEFGYHNQDETRIDRHYRGSTVNTEISFILKLLDGTNAILELPKKYCPVLKEAFGELAYSNITNVADQRIIFNKILLDTYVISNMRDVENEQFFEDLILGLDQTCQLLLDIDGIDFEFKDYIEMFRDKLDLNKIVTVTIVKVPYSDRF